MASLLVDMQAKRYFTGATNEPNFKIVYNSSMIEDPTQCILTITSVGMTSLIILIATQVECGKPMYLRIAYTCIKTHGSESRGQEGTKCTSKQKM